MVFPKVWNPPPIRFIYMYKNKYTFMYNNTHTHANMFFFYYISVYINKIGAIQSINISFPHTTS